MPEYYASQYLNVIELDKSCLLFNGVTGSLDEVSVKLGRALSGTKGKIKFLRQDESAFLAKRGHLTTLKPEEEKRQFLEMAAVLCKNNNIREKKSGSVMLLLSYNCNLRCNYCYQKAVRERKAAAIMRPQLIDDIFLTGFEGLFPGLKQEAVNLSFYGGEPFLPAHSAAVKRALFYAQKHGLNCGAISNATMLQAYKNFLGPQPGRINFVQVSLDGDKASHDSSRIARRGTGTFDKIISALHLLLKKKTRVNVRINVDSGKLESVERLLDFLKEQDILDHPLAYVYIHPLHNHFNQTQGGALLNSLEVGKRLCSHAMRARSPVDRKADALRYLFGQRSGVALSRTSFCMQCSENAFVIDPFGDIYGCYEEAGREEFIIGKIKSGQVVFNDLRGQYLRRNVLNLKKCQSCPVVLVCGGCCGAQSREQTGDLFEPYCDDSKELILAAIKKLYLEKSVNARLFSAPQSLLQPHL